MTFNVVVTILSSFRLKGMCPRTHSTLSPQQRQSLVMSPSISSSAQKLPTASCPDYRVGPTLPAPSGQQV